jgi:hypothetical protein
MENSLSLFETGDGVCIWLFGVNHLIVLSNGWIGGIESSLKERGFVYESLQTNKNHNTGMSSMR